MCAKAEISEQIRQDEQLKTREKIGITLRKLRALKNESLNLISQCEELKKLCLEHRCGKVLLCSRCGDEIELGQEVAFRDSAENEKRYYHKECFQELLIS